MKFEKEMIGRILFHGAIFLIVAFLFFATSFYYFSSERKSSQKSLKFEKQNFNHDILPSLSEKKFSKEEYILFQKTLKEKVDLNNPLYALEELKKAVNEGRVGKDCHNLTHDVGRAAYAKYKDPIKAIEYKEQVCGFGYIHGVIESYVENTDNPFERVATVCDAYSEHRSKMECFHAVGHAFMILFGNDLPLAVKMCEEYRDAESINVCVQGVFMENFSADEEHRSDYVKKEDPSFPCSDQKEVYKEDCYKMAPLYYLTVHKEDFGDILNWCQGIPDPYNYWCARGASLQLLQYSLKISDFEKFCLSGTESQVKPCIEEMVRNKLLYHPDEVGVICKKGLKFEFTKKICEQALTDRLNVKLK